MKIMFMGTPDFAVPALRALAEKYEVVCLVSQPDRPSGRGHKLVETATKIAAKEYGIPVEQPETLRNGAFMPILERYRPEMIVVAAYGRILPDDVLQYPKHGCINIHGSILPKYRGAAPIQRAVLNGEKETGVTIMYMAHDMDAGDIISIQKTEIRPNETAGELFDRLSSLGAQALLEVIEDIYNGTAPRTPQDPARVTMAPMLTKDMAKLDFHRSALEFVHYVCGLNPWPIAMVEHKAMPIKVFAAELGDETKETPGRICSIEKSGIHVACADGRCVVLKTLQKPGKKPTDAYAFAQGEHLQTGDDF